jgi:hypothetical protein
MNRAMTTLLRNPHNIVILLMIGIVKYDQCRLHMSCVKYLYADIITIQLQWNVSQYIICIIYFLLFIVT